MVVVPAVNNVESEENSGAMSPYRVAAGLLYNDAGIFLACLALLSAPTLVLAFRPASPLFTGLSSLFLDRFCQMGAIAMIGLRWRRRLHAGQGLAPMLVFIRLLAWGLSSAFLIGIPVAGLAVSRDVEIALFFLVLLVLGVVWSVRTYFYCALVSLLGLGVMSGVSRAVEVAKRRNWSVAQALLSPLGVTVLLVALASTPYPDGRSLTCLLIASCLEGVFWILSAYTSLAFCLVLLSEGEWQKSGLHHYRRETLATLQTQGRDSLARWLRPRSGFGLLCIALCVIAGNLARQLQQPPASSVAIKQVRFEDYLIHVDLLVEDPTYHFRGFIPAAFSVATKTRFSQSQGLVSATDKPDIREVLPALSDDSPGPKILHLSFRSGKTAAALQGADNLWLWYKLVPLMPLQVSDPPRGFEANPLNTNG